MALQYIMQAVALILSVVIGSSGGGGCGVLAFTTPFSPSLHTSTYFQRTKLCDGSQSENDISSGSSRASFEDLGLSSELVEVTQRMNWYKPTPVQQMFSTLFLGTSVYHIIIY